MTPDYRSALRALVAEVGALPIDESNRDLNRAYRDGCALLYGPCPTCAREVERREDGTVPTCATCVCAICCAPATTYYDEPRCDEHPRGWVAA